VQPLQVLVAETIHDDPDTEVRRGRLTGGGGGFVAWVPAHASCDGEASDPCDHRAVTER